LSLPPGTPCIYIPNLLKTKEVKKNEEQINHQKPEKINKGIKKLKNKETLTLQNTIKVTIIITMTTNHREQNNQTQ